MISFPIRGGKSLVPSPSHARTQSYPYEFFFYSTIPGIPFDVNRDAYFMKKDLLSTALDEERRSQRLLHGRQYRRGEREREEWLNRDATRGGSFFEGRKTMRELLQSEEKCNDYDDGVDVNTRTPSMTGRGGDGGDGANESSKHYPPSLLSGQFQRSFRSFLNGGGERTTATQRRRHGPRRQILVAPPSFGRWRRTACD